MNGVFLVKEILHFFMSFVTVKRRFVVNQQRHLCIYFLPLLTKNIIVIPFNIYIFM